jgi:hypothetical protein
LHLFPVEQGLYVKRVTMKKTALVLATVGATSPAQARWGHGGWGWGGPGIAGGLLAGAVIGGIASSAYGWGPGYGYYGGYAPAYYGGWGYSPVVSYAPAYYAPAYGYRYRRVFRPAYAYYGGPYRHHGWHHRWHRW